MTETFVKGCLDSRLVLVLPVVLGLVVLLAGCSVSNQEAPEPAESLSFLPTEGGMDSYTFEGSGSGSTDPAELAGSYVVTWEVSDNYLDNGLEGTFSVWLQSHDVPFFEDLNADMWEVGEGSNSLLVEDLYLAGYYLVIAVGDDAEWSVSFERHEP